MFQQKVMGFLVHNSNIETIGFDIEIIVSIRLLHMSPSDSSMSLTSLCIDQVKGWTRSSVVMTFLIAASELDISDPQAVELLRPFFHVLDKCWMVPVHVSCN